MGINIVCLVKATLPTEAKIALDAKGRAADERAKPIINPYDEFAVEEAVKLRESGAADKATLLCVGSAKAALEPIQRGLAMGADDAILVDTGDRHPLELDGAATAAAIAAVLKTIPFDLVLCGRVAVDTGAAEVPGRVAELLGLPLAQVVNKLDVAPGRATAHREADGRTEVVELALPAIATADKGLNKPRYPNLPSIMKAKKKPVDTRPLEAVLGGAPQATRRVVANELPPGKGPVRMVAGAPAEAARALVGALRDEAKVL
ncbi:MAG: electron transfer flavoprotein subunit beta/FixA family protein [Candidatus Sumerlaeia bacterium]|nr:electron transfer flavoprotein subunit beta/FixA family protein [Candidatus Sumerlaeia bacterium]